ncbi:hypothetical protein MN608_08874 [Microdochium nivale]|nr:hypothetical protein MN608_08874 [Microdochium nivale]
MHSPHSVSVRALAAAAAFSGLVTANPKLNTTIPDHIPLDYIPPVLTGQVSVPGFRLDKPFGTADNEVDGWTLQINMTEAGGYRGNRFVVRLKPPAPPAEGALWDAQTGEWLVAEDVSPTWSLQWVSLFDADFPLPYEGNNAEDGSCPGSVFSEQCRRDYIRAILDNAAGVSGYEVAISSPKSCKGFISPNLLFPISTTPRLIHESLVSWRYNVSGPAWEHFKDKTWPFIFIWGPPLNSGETLGEEHIKFNCIKADRNATTGELLVPDPSDDNTNTTTTPTGPNMPTPTAGASFPSLWSGTVAMAIAIAALGMSMF